MKKFFLTCLFILTYATGAHARDDAQYWSRYSAKLIDTKYIDFVEFWEFRVLHDWSRVGYWQGTQQIQSDYFKHLGLNVAYTYLESESISSSTSVRTMPHQHRLELEAVPRFQWKNGIQFTNRNRYEFRWFEHQGSNHGRYRDLYELSFPIHGLGPIQNIYANNELFIDMHKHALNENRLIPVGLTIKLFGKNTFKVFYMIQSKKDTKTWSSNQIFGTQISLAF